MGGDGTGRETERVMEIISARTGGDGCNFCPLQVFNAHSHDE